jgi:hypothetical protein
VRVAAGATAPVTDHAGNVWVADTGFTDGQTFTRDPPVSIAKTDDGQLYQSGRYGDTGGTPPAGQQAYQPAAFHYTFNVPKGSYTVTLRFAESYWKAPGSRKFNVSINGTKELTEFDPVLAAGGMNVAIDELFVVDAVAGQITIQFDLGSADRPLINAIEIVPR